MGRYAEAEAMHAAILAARREVLGPRNPATLNTLNNLTALYMADGRYAQAEVACRDLALLYQQQYGKDDEGAMIARTRLTAALVALDRPAEAETIARELLAQRERLTPDHWQRENVRLRLGAALHRQRKFAEAEAELSLAVAGSRRHRAALPVSARNQIVEAGELLIDVYRQTGRPEKAAAVRATLPREVAPPPRATSN